ncbi:hypothetical protein KVF89_04665 [Nocardioides carbamazepini]|uniref:hypothetical protein n=1 Tax=Nocardioides carbamazepini TaxID=2854259 RepID=UPI002149A41D|nr:hypothetical protein [Nocardioides carbamazepini]MCR1781821.1 hypothetical protein [Nocardioides carbamazepini]
MSNRLGVLLLLIALLVSAPGASVHAAGQRPAEAAAQGGWKSEYAAAPNFPESELYLDVKGRPQASGRVRLKVWGTNRSGPISPGSSITYTYDLDLFVAARSVVKACPVAFDEMRSIFIANGDKTAHLYSGLHLGEGGAFKKVLPYKSGTTRKVLYCAYVRWIIDDVVVSGLKHNLRKAKRRG